MKRLGIPCTQTLQIDVEPPVKSQKRGTVVASEKEKDTPQPSAYRSLLSILPTL